MKDNFIANPKPVKTLTLIRFRKEIFFSINNL